VAIVSIEHRFDLGAVRTLVNSPRGGVAQDLLRRGLLVETQAKRNLGGVGGPKRVDTGRLRASINTQLTERGGMLVVLVGTNVRYARWVHDGTGLYGPRGTRIRPRRAKRLRFSPKGSGVIIYRRSVKGMIGNPFLANALRAAGR
jgi:hypothetical protein